MSSRNTYQCSIKGLVEKDGKYLVIKDSDGWWEFPGGGLDPEESLEECMSRECMEELGVECEIIGKDPFKAWIAKTPSGHPRIIILYKIKLLSDNFKVTGEAEEAMFVTAQELQDIKLVPQLEPIKEILK